MVNVSQNYMLRNRKRMFLNLIIFGVATLFIVLSFATQVFAAEADRRPQANPNPPNPNTESIDKCKKTFFGLVPWYYYMDDEFTTTNPTEKKLNQTAPCDIKCFNLFRQTVANECGQKRSDLPALMLAIIDNLLRIAGIVAVAFVLVGSFQYVTAGGNAERATQARSTLINALAGMAIAIVAVAFVSFVGNSLGG